MSDLIDRQEAIDALAKVAGVGNRALDAIRALPSVELRRRCEECKYSRLSWYEEPCDSCTMLNDHYEDDTRGEEE